MKDLKKDDIVFVKKPQNTENFPFWNPEMNCVNNTYQKIYSVGNWSYKIVDNYYNYNTDWLTKVDLNNKDFKFGYTVITPEFEFGKIICMDIDKKYHVQTSDNKSRWYSPDQLVLVIDGSVNLDFKSFPEFKFGDNVIVHEPDYYFQEESYDSWIYTDMSKNHNKYRKIIRVTESQTYRLKNLKYNYCPSWLEFISSESSLKTSINQSLYKLLEKEYG